MLSVSLVCEPCEPWDRVTTMIRFAVLMPRIDYLGCWSTSQWSLLTVYQLGFQIMPAFLTESRAICLRQLHRTGEKSIAAQIDQASLVKSSTDLIPASALPRACLHRLALRKDPRPRQQATRRRPNRQDEGRNKRKKRAMYDRQKVE